MLVSLAKLIDALMPCPLLDYVLTTLSEQFDTMFSLMGKSATASDAYTIWTV